MATHKSRNHRASKAPQHRVEAELMLVEARRNPVLSAAQACSAAQAHALLAIEQRLGELCALLESAAGSGRTAPRLDNAALAVTSPPRVA
jgi:hypothetical protein